MRITLRFAPLCVALNFALLCAVAHASTPNYRLTNDAGQSERARVAFAPDGTIVVVWQDDRFGNDEILWQKFRLNGQPATSIINVSSTAAASHLPDIACDANGISHIVWQEGENLNGVGNVYLARLTPDGAPSLANTFVADFGGSARVSVPFVGQTDVVWQRFQTTEQDIRFARYDAAGLVTCPRTLNVVTLPAIQMTPVIANRTDGVALIHWRDMDTGFGLHLYEGAITNACGSSLKTIHDSNSILHPTSTWNGQYLFVLFELSGNIYNHQGTNNRCKISQGSGTSTWPAVGADASNGYLTWQDSRDGNDEIYFCRFWGCTNRTGDIRLTDSAAASQRPDIAVRSGGSGEWAVVWHDHRDGNAEIYLAANACTESIDPVAAWSQPDTLVAEDTHVDLALRGCNFQPGATVSVDPPSATILRVTYWDSQRLHVNLDVGNAPGTPGLLFTVHNPDGRASVPLAVDVMSFTDLPGAPPHPREYAPIFWHAPGEPWYPVSPFFPDAAGSTLYVSSEQRNQAYEALSEPARRSLAHVYYHVPTNASGPRVFLFPDADGTACYAYEYWLYFTYDRFEQCDAIAWNQHYHDWEKCFVFVSAADHSIAGIVGSAHLEQTTNNYFAFAVAPPTGFHPTVLVEKGGHATAPDIDGDGRFDHKVDANGCHPEDYWGIQDLVTHRDDSDRIFPPGSGVSSTYGLSALSGLQRMADPDFTAETEFWSSSREYACSACNPAFRLWNTWGWIGSSRTFKHSPVAAHDPASALALIEQRLCVTLLQPSVSCWEPSAALSTAHLPIEHAWTGDQRTYRDEPLKILPACYRSDPVNSVAGRLADSLSDVVCGVAAAFPLGDSEGGVDKDSTGPTPGFSYARLREDREIRFGGLANGVYAMMFSPAGYAPFQQTIDLNGGEHQLGVTGEIGLVPAAEALTLRAIVRDHAARPVPMARIRFVAEPDSLLVPTLTDSAGVVFAGANAASTFKVVLESYGYADSVVALGGAPGDTLTAVFDLPFVITAVGPNAPRAVHAYPVRLAQNHPNPFNPRTSIDFELLTPSEVTLQILDTRGRIVRTLMRASLRAGVHSGEWDGRDDHGREVGSGTYHCRLHAGTATVSRKLVLVR